MEIVRSINNFEYMCDALADASTCVSTISKLTDKFILITCEQSDLKKEFSNFNSNCKALFYIGQPDAEIMFAARSAVLLIMQSDSIEEAVFLASQFKVSDVNKIVFIPCVDHANGISAEEMINKFKKAVHTI